MKSLSRVRLFATPWTVAYQALRNLSVHGIFQARVLEWVAISFSREFPYPGIEPGTPALQADALPSEPPVSHRLLKEMPNGMVTWKDGLTISYKTKLTLTIHFSHCTPGIYPNELEIHPQRNLHVNVVALSLIAKTWKQPRFPSIGEWINCHTLYDEILFSTKNK